MPDLAIEVVLTSGGVDKLAVYQRLGVREVWFWHQGHFEVYHLRDGVYEAIASSELLPRLDLTLLAYYVGQEEPLEALLAYREKIRASLAT